MADISKSIGILTETVKATRGRVHEVEQTTVDHEARLQDIEKQCTFKNDNKTPKARFGNARVAFKTPEHPNMWDPGGH